MGREIRERRKKGRRESLPARSLSSACSRGTQKAKKRESEQWVCVYV